MLRFEDISFAFGSQPVLDGVNLSAQRGQITCIIGPSGCGKTTLLRLAAGLLPTQSGRVLLDDDVLSAPGEDLVPEARPVGLVFQEGALFPHMDVRSNIAFGLSGSRQEKDGRVRELLAQVGMKGLGGRFPHTLSGGQQQRVALARALAPKPSVLLFDEPYANLDQQRRIRLREQARVMIRENNAVGVFVTHDPEEVLEIGDHIAVMDQGQIVQAGPPEAIYDHPARHYVACLFGTAQSVRARLTGDDLETPFGLWSRAALGNDNALHGAVELVMRPESLALSADRDSDLVIADIRLSGPDALFIVRSAEGDSVRVAVERPHSFKPGDPVQLTAREGRVFAFSLDKNLANENHSQ